MNKLNILTAATLLALTSVCGCKTMELRGPNWINQEERPRLISPLNFGNSKEDVPTTPHKMAVIWKDTVMQRPGSPSTRGFGGRVYFYGAENNAIKVDGEMIVYGFDSEAGKSEADKKFVFKSESLNGHYGKTDLGHSYSFWIPWDKSGSDRIAVTLIPIFKNADGSVVKGPQTINVLPGPEPKDRMAKKRAKRMGSYIGSEVGSSDGDIRLTAGESPVDKIIRNGIVEEDTSTRIRTTTISLPRHIAQRLAEIPPSTGPVNTVQTTKRSIEFEDSTVDLRDQTLSQASQSVPEPAPEPKELGKPKSRYPAFGAL